VWLWLWHYHSNSNGSETAAPRSSDHETGGQRKGDIWDGGGVVLHDGVRDDSGGGEMKNGQRTEEVPR